MISSKSAAKSGSMRGSSPNSAACFFARAVDSESSLTFGSAGRGDVPPLLPTHRQHTILTLPRQGTSCTHGTPNPPPGPHNPALTCRIRYTASSRMDADSTRNHDRIRQRNGQGSGADRTGIRAGFEQAKRRHTCRLVFKFVLLYFSYVSIDCSEGLSFLLGEFCSCDRCDFPAPELQ